jgi:hypothetical protein
MNKLLILLALATVPQALSQEAKQEVQKSYEWKHLQGDKVNRAVMFTKDLMAGRVRIVWEPILRQLAVVGSADNVAQALTLLQKLDVPDVTPQPKNIAIMVYVVGAYLDASHTRGSPLPSELDSVEKEMRASFAYKGFGMWDQIPMTARNGSSVTEYSGILPASSVGTSAKYFYKLTLSSPRLQEDGKTITIPDFRFTVEVPSLATGKKQGESGVRTDLIVREGQKLVLGKIRLDDQDSTAFLVITAKIMP